MFDVKISDEAFSNDLWKKYYAEIILRLKFSMSKKNAKAIEKNAYAKQKLERKCRKKTVGYAKLFWRCRATKPKGQAKLWVSCSIVAIEKGIATGKENVDVLIRAQYNCL